MRKTLESLSDKLLGMFVTKMDVGAICPPDPFYRHCYCTERSDYRQYCSTNGACRLICGECRVFRTCGA